MKVGGEGVVLAGGTDTLKCMKPRGTPLIFFKQKSWERLFRHDDFHQNLLLFSPAAVTVQIEIS